MEKHTILESLIERRNFFQGRLVTNMADEVYFSRRAQKAKKNSQEAVDNLASLKVARQNIKNDREFLTVFDELIAKESK